MIKAFFLLLLLVVPARAQHDTSEWSVKSAEQAIVRFQQVRDAELKTSLKKSQLDIVLSTQDALSLRVELLDHWNYEASPDSLDHGASRQHDPLEHQGAADEYRYVGTFTAAASSKNPTWHLSYTIDWMGGGVAVYLDAVTGKVLYLCAIIGE